MFFYQVNVLNLSAILNEPAIIPTHIQSINKAESCDK